MITVSGIRVLFGDPVDMSGVDFPDATAWTVSPDGGLTITGTAKDSGKEVVATFDADRWVAVLMIDALAAKDR